MNYIDPMPIPRIPQNSLMLQKLYRHMTIGLQPNWIQTSHIMEIPNLPKSPPSLAGIIISFISSWFINHYVNVYVLQTDIWTLDINV